MVLLKHELSASSEKISAVRQRQIPQSMRGFQETTQVYSRRACWLDRHVWFLILSYLETELQVGCHRVQLVAVELEVLS